MKAQILKIAGVKTEAEFYKKYPTEEAFMEKHGKKLQKAQYSAVIKKAKAPVNIQSTTDAMDKSIDKGISVEDSYAAAKKAKKERNEKFIKTALSSANSIVGGLQALSEERDQLRKMDALAKIADLEKNIKPVEQYPQRIMRPEDSRTTPGQMYKPLGDPNFTYLSRNGSEIGGNPTEIQNMYNPGDLYSDLGFEPLGDSNIKQFQTGGTIDYAKFAPTFGAIGGSAGSAFSGGKFKTNTAADTGSAIGGLAGAYFGPAGSAIGSAAGGFIGGIIGQNAMEEAEKKRNKGIGLVGTASTQDLLQSKYKSFAKNGMTLEEGGYMNPEYNPQVIAKFGDYDVDKLFAPPADADMLRAGGHLKEYTPPSERAMYTGRDLPYQMQYGGGIEPLVPYNRDYMNSLANDYTDFYSGKVPYANINDDGYDAFYHSKYDALPNQTRTAKGWIITMPGSDVVDFVEDDGSTPEPKAKKNRIVKRVENYEVSEPASSDLGRITSHLQQQLYPSIKQGSMSNFMRFQSGGQMQGSTSDGELHALWGGGFEPLSYNPVTGTTIDLAVGNSHDKRDSRTGQTGIGVGYEQGGTIDDAEAEIETNEPVMSMQNGGKSGDKIVVGAMVNPITNRQFKKDVKDIAMKEQKQTKLLQKAADLANKTKTYTTIDKIRLNTAKAIEDGAKMKLGQLGQQNQEYAILQNAIKDTAQEFGYKAADLAKGKITPLKESDIYGRDGLALGKDGLNMKTLGDLAALYQTAVKTRDAMAIGKFQKAALEALGADEVKKITGMKKVTKKAIVDGRFGPATNALGKAVTKKIYDTVEPRNTSIDTAVQPIPKGEEPKEYAPNVPNWMPAESRVFTPGVSEAEEKLRKAKKNAATPKDNSLLNIFGSALNSLVPFVQGSDQYKLDANQLLGERFALANNQQEPVFAQSYTPELIAPYSIGMDDQINQVTSEANAAYRLMQNNPELAANAAAQAYNAKNQIRSKALLANQEQRFNVMKANTDALNQAKMANIQLYADQADKMVGAKQNTIKQTQAALESIGEKIAKARNEQMQFNVARATFPAFNYTPGGQAYKNPLYNTFFNMSGGGSSKSRGMGIIDDENGNTLLPQYDPYGNIKGYTIKKTKASSDDDTEDVVVRNGGNLARAIKNL